VFTNTVKANLQCSGNNSLLITGGGNTAMQKLGQCAGF
jgi:glutamine amidotransferase PdxT